MPDLTATARDLLIVAVQDLHDAETAMTDRLSRVREAARDPELRDIIAADAKRSGDQRAVLAEIARALDAEPQDAPNIWLRAILDDAGRDAETIATGPLLDVALAGALRKGKQSERVSYETAIALARRVQMAEAAERLAAIRDEEAQCDGALRQVMERLAAIA